MKKSAEEYFTKQKQEIKDFASNNRISQKLAKFWFDCGNSKRVNILNRKDVVWCGTKCKEHIAFKKALEIESRGE